MQGVANWAGTRTQAALVGAAVVASGRISKAVESIKSSGVARIAVLEFSAAGKANPP
jgi:hypothetical protein